MSIKIREMCCTKKSKPCWNDMEELKYLVCAIDNCKCPNIPPPLPRSIILPPRIEEIPGEIPLQRPPYVPPPPCCPIRPGPCCLRLLPSPICPPSPLLPQPPLSSNPFCHPCISLSCYSCK